MLKIIGGLTAALLLAACANTPDVKMSYYPAKSITTISVQRTVDCTTDKTSLVIVDVVKPPMPVYSADYTKDPMELPIQSLDGALSDNDLSFAFYEDGRLKTINATTTGQGATILKSAISLGSAVAGLGGAPHKALAPAHKLPACSTISHWGNGKPLTLNYSTSADLAAVSPYTNQPIPADADSQAILDQINQGLPPEGKMPILQYIIDQVKPNQSGASEDADANKDDVKLQLQTTEDVAFHVQSHQVAIWTGHVLVPADGRYTLPIPKPVPFGKQTFSLTLSEAGAITQINYAKTNGTADALGVANAAVTAATPPTDATVAADVKAKADLIAQEQRLARCKAKPAQCQ